MSKAIMIIDMQVSAKKYTNSERSLALVNQENLVKNLSLPLVIVETLTNHFYETYESLRNYVSKPNDLIMRKIAFDAFMGTEYLDLSLEDHLTNLKVNELIVAGWHRDICVAASIESALRYGYTVHTSPDLLAPKGPVNERFYKWYFPNQVRDRLVWHSSVDDLMEAVK